MSKWVDDILIVDNICDYTHSHDTLRVRVKDHNKFVKYNNYFVEYCVFRYTYVDCGCNKYVKEVDRYKIFKNSFITSVLREKDGIYVIEFYFGAEVTDEKEFNIVSRGVKLLKLREKIKST